MEKLNFLTAGIPLAASDYKSGLEVLENLGLDGIEAEFVRGVRISENSKNVLLGRDEKFIITAHAPFYINLNSKEEEKIEASIQRIIETAKMVEFLNGYSIVYHAAYYMEKTPETTFENVRLAHEKIFNSIGDTKIFLRPETTGKKTQWGDVDEIIKLSKEFKQVLPCVDFSHLYARETGKNNTYDEFCLIFEKIANALGQYALDNFHAHIAGIEYTKKGEKKHLNLDESDFNYKDLFKAFKKFNVKGVVVCESPNIEDDCKLLKDYFESL